MRTKYNHNAHIQIRGDRPPETPVFIQSGHETLFGILTEPPACPPRGTVLILWGGDKLPTFGKNQIKTRMARRFAIAGYSSLRIDYPGNGDSTGSPPPYSLENPFVEHAIAATGWLSQHEGSNVVLLGSCFGGRLALAALESLASVAGIILIAPPVWDYTDPDPAAHRRRLSDADRIRKASAGFLDPVASALDRCIPLLMIYGTDDKWYPDFALARLGKLGELLQTAGCATPIQLIDGWGLHGSPSIAGEEALIASCHDWLAHLHR